jgi:ribosomal protein S18 acetylase RimI-like enzyme
VLTIAPTVPADLDALVAAHHRAFAQDIERYGVGPAGYADPDWHRMIANKLHYFAMREDEEIVGGIIVADEGDGRYFLNTLFIDPTAQGRGLGAQALAHLDQTFPDATFWYLVTPQASTNAQRLYERAGYLRTGEVTETDPTRGVSIALYRYERERARM